MKFICLTCGVQYADSPAPPDRCAVCEDERQYVPREGQRWTTLKEMQAAGHKGRPQTAAPGGSCDA